MQVLHSRRGVTVTSPFGGTGGGAPGAPRLPTPPTGWPIGSYATYEEAQRAVDHLADGDFPVQEVTIVGVDLMLVERVTGKLSWGKVIGGGAASGAWFGLFVGVLLSLFSSPEGFVIGPILVGLATGVLFGILFAAATYASSRGRRDFVSASQLVAGRYDVLCQPRHAEKGRDILARLAMGPRHTSS
ncbi:general stress protein [Actinoalloteichus hymeniacidonis]|uniref:general stress protein n=1 Tax=Actinoalloteichus hymeniacidonis TaxID=340345 RepID=UPI001C84563B|nr:general stress protein [Actinoalloteichus hymeniacidonis]